MTTQNTATHLNSTRSNYIRAGFSILTAFCLMLALAPWTQGQTGAVRLRPAPQKFRTFYSSDDPKIPSTIRARLLEPRTSAGGASGRWQIEPNALAADTRPALRLSFDSGLPVGGLRTIAIASDGAVWAGGSEGLVRYQKASHAWDRWQYFAGQRYLPSDDVIALAPGLQGSMWVRTSMGVSHIELRLMTLAQKAAWFEERIAKRHKRHGLVAGVSFGEPGNPATSHQYPNDNDGLWTSIYAGAQSFRYAVTKDPKARMAAIESTEAMLALLDITGRPGFPARSRRHKSEPRHRDGVWHFTKDGEWEWKGDTSSDEIVGHFFGYAVAYDLVADERLKERLRKAVAAMADHLLEHGYQLTDIHGGSTRWG
ncbi:MAG TPA: hypothetical protein VG778_08200, partial [Blastocatellia bacterium]|nr:hypothetical protein [Blastocatellia bacterium]